MTCYTPSLVEFADSAGLFGLDYGFIMDNVEQLLSMKEAAGSDFVPFQYIQNPTLFAFEDVIKYTDGLKLEIMVSRQELFAINTLVLPWKIFFIHYVTIAGATLFSTITLVFVVDCCNFYTVGNRNEYPTTTCNLLSLLYGLMASYLSHIALHEN